MCGMHLPRGIPLKLSVVVERTRRASIRKLAPCARRRRALHQHRTDADTHRDCLRAAAAPRPSSSARTRPAPCSTCRAEPICLVAPPADDVSLSLSVSLSRPSHSTAVPLRKWNWKTSTPIDHRTIVTLIFLPQDIHTEMLNNSSCAVRGATVRVARATNEGRGAAWSPSVYY